MIGRLIDGRYQVRSRIARGGMATVYLATDLRLERRVAIKIMHHHLADDSQFTQRFIQEARSAARLAHPNVVNVFDQGQDGDSAYLVMEYLPGITLRDLLQDYGSLTSEQTIDIIEAVLSGLAAAHKAGIVHRDLKPENVLLADDGRIKIGDFGLARAATANTATGAALLGTIAYLSPELVTRGIADTRSDIYAVGIMMFEMLTGEQPFKGEQPMQIAYQHAHEHVPAPSTKNPRVPAELDELVLWATARDPEHRPRDARAMLDQLLDTQESLRTALPTQATSAQRTMVLPAAAPLPTQSTAETQILGGRPAVAAPADTGPALTENTASLAVQSRKRRSKGWMLLVIILVLTAAAGVGGWWFGAGPGAAVTVPDVTDSTPEEATAALQELGFEVDPSGTMFSIEIEAGRVAGTDPEPGAALAPGETVTLLVSQGRELFAVEELRGLQESVAQTVIREHWTEGTAIRQFDAEVPEGQVLDALDGQGAPLAAGAQYGDQLPITLVVSAGPLPDLAGRSVEDATAVLGEAGLTAGQNLQQFSDAIEEGAVIGIITTNEDGSPKVIRVDDTVDLAVSKGPEPVEVPDVVGDTWAAAKEALTAAGFQLEYNRLADAFPGAFVVSRIDPEAGETAPKGSTIRVNFAGF
ncbi:serine/threonine-protein kinase [Diaminobutyricimonas aerilata]|uniref:non-specific serine/threonine protein kinase n=2 Tax=Diaminobutyricimonas aerilata TaxID=1162967 RepID=A0A2M9CKH8_9MICO|nr:serine/threonine-protein kinase [Diaminobutyricimonas aerilata]